MKVKICGLTSPSEAVEVCNNRIDYIGMVLFFEKSKRNIDISKAQEIMAVLPPDIRTVAVTVAPSVTQAREVCAAGFDIIQVHGDLSHEVINECTVDIWKAFNIKDMDSVSDYIDEPKIKGFVYDSAEPGSGKAYDYGLLSHVPRDKDKLFILAGGLNSSNISEAISRINPDVVDVSSGVEYSDRKGKNPKLVQEFVANCFRR